MINSIQVLLINLRVKKFSFNSRNVQNQILLSLFIKLYSGFINVIKMLVWSKPKDVSIFGREEQHNLTVRGWNQQHELRVAV